MFILLRAFSSGAVALTGVEAISNGVPAFKKPESKNAASTLVAMGLILGTFFMGISVLASHLKPTVLEPASQDYQTLLSLMARYVYGGTTFLYYILQFSTFAILVLAANTAFADFPRVLVDHRQRRLPAATAGQPWRPPRLLERHRRALARRGRAHRRVRWRHERVDPARTPSACSPASRCRRRAW